MFLKRKIKQPPPGQPKPPLTRLKELPADQQAKVLDLLRANTYEQAQPLVEQLLGFGCSRSVLSRFFQWQQTQEAVELSEDMLTQASAFLQEAYPDWTEEKMRESACAFFTLHAVSQRDSRAFSRIAQLGLKSGRDRLLAERLKFDKAKTARKLVLNRQRLQLDREKFEKSQEKKLHVALDAVAEAFKNNPEALALYRQAAAKLGDIV